MSLDIDLYFDIDTGGNEPHRIYLYEGNITHNLRTMADKAGIYRHIWRPSEMSCEKAGDIIETVEKGLKKMKDNPDFFMQFDSPNGWGLYRHFVPFVEKYLEACKEHPKAKISVSR